MKASRWYYFKCQQVPVEIKHGYVPNGANSKPFDSKEECQKYIDNL